MTRLALSLILAGLYSPFLAPLRANQNPAGPSSGSNPFAQDASRRDAGRVRFQQVCSSCHGASGEGGEGEGHGPNLIDNPEIRRAKDSGIFGIIHNGIPGTPMPRFALGDSEIWELVTFVRSLNSPAILINVAGDWHKGEAIFFGKGGCGKCHMIRGQGGYLGSDLSNIGSSTRVDDLRRAIVAPSSSPRDGFRPVLIETSDGRKIRAVAKHFSNWSMQLLDEDGQLHLLSGPAMKQVAFQNISWMPNYSNKLTLDEIQDLLAFLSRQSILREQAPEPPSAMPKPEPER